MSDDMKLTIAPADTKIPPPSALSLAALAVFE
jgi:hypothetical protein